MRTLYLLRHAKSSSSDGSLRDFDRPLKRRGREAAEQIGMRLGMEKLNEPLVICSPAVRTRETADLVLQSAGLRADERFDERIYEASLRDLVQVVAEIPDERQIAILIGHNPGMEELLTFLTGESRRIPTCALAKIQLEVESWKDMNAGEGSLELLITPKELPDD
ncbi:MAG TPA: histidine phosphatase family protein [Pyrinomonadaceae bacterium]|nr:histidine phosphatase family protein [Pyrinomonadaceae bacterium]